jgi:hypothetical protein
MPNVYTLHIVLLGLYAEMSTEKGNPYKPHIHTLDIMNGLFMQLEMFFVFFLGGGGLGGGERFFFGILFCTSD